MTDRSNLYKGIQLFTYLKELNNLSNEVIVNTSNYSFYKSIDDIPMDSENIELFYRDDNYENEDGVLLSVHNPVIPVCPEPPDDLKKWLKRGWDIEEKVVHVDSITHGLEDGFGSKQKTLIVETFTDNPQRVAEYNSWLALRNRWWEEKERLRLTKELFGELYNIFYELERESENKEIIIANGMLLDRDDLDICHPIITKRVKLEYDAKKNIIYLKDVEKEPELYTPLFNILQDINGDMVKKMQEELLVKAYHPLDRDNTPIYLKTLVRQLTSESLYSKNGRRADWQQACRLFMFWEPCIILRNRLDGTAKALDDIIEDINETGKLPAPLEDVVGGGIRKVEDVVEDRSIEAQLAAVGGESMDILLCKESNKEQLNIAKNIGRYNAVLVQGPPGTGKTHTIANLMGHFLAQGKSILVTSHTTKALRVLKEKLVPGLQHLCVSVLDDNHKDMEESIAGINEYRSSNSISELQEKIQKLERKRKKVIAALADRRGRIFSILNRECKCLDYNGEDFSPVEAAKFVALHNEDLGYIPGTVKLKAALPLDIEKLRRLYATNAKISSEEEDELAYELPDPQQLLRPEELETLLQKKKLAEQQIIELARKHHWNTTRLQQYAAVEIATKKVKIRVDHSSLAALKALARAVSELETVQPWMKAAIADGKHAGPMKVRWEKLVQQIKDTCAAGELATGDELEHSVEIIDTSVKLGVLQAAFLKLREYYAHGNGLTRFIKAIIDKDIKIAQHSVLIDDLEANSVEACDIVLHALDYRLAQEKCARYWDELLAVHNVKPFLELDSHEPQRVAYNYIGKIEQYLNWYEQDFEYIKNAAEAVNISLDYLLPKADLQSDTEVIEQTMDILQNEIPDICHIAIASFDLAEVAQRIVADTTVLEEASVKDSEVCFRLKKQLKDGNLSNYEKYYKELTSLYMKYSVQRERKELLAVVSAVAPDWANAIAAREGIHGLENVPLKIYDAWKWKQLSAMLDDIAKEPLSDLQKETLGLSKEYRRLTAEYAECLAGLHLLKTVSNDISMSNALEGWAQNVKRIGKGTGKRAEEFRIAAKKLMPKCQRAVPAWIMPIHKVLETLDVRKNKFDIVIIDEASQSNILALAVLYMGKKLVIVGDDKQVSPIGVGKSLENLTQLQARYIEGVIPNANLYDYKMSVYDIAKTTFAPLMLREHFRCVPDIIGFSNMLSYDYKIKPLREASSSNLLPAVVNYRVHNGRRDGVRKINIQEAKTIVALIKACMKEPEYSGKTFGIISLLGNEQVREIQNILMREISPREIDQRKILCGDASNFQGDERDVIFLSMVDSGNGTGPLNLRGFGADDMYRKRYNVAASRARDQLWVVDSLDSGTDLQAGDIRKKLIDYSLDPKAISRKNMSIKQAADSPFEEAVAKALVARGYHIAQQWEVGAYRIDIVAIFEKQMVAIECDGERYHSGEQKLREDMERQTILERLGWRFIRIRGSEYYRNSEAAIQRVVEELDNYGIQPENSGITLEENNSELLERVKARALRILNGQEKSQGDGIEDDIFPDYTGAEKPAPMVCPRAGVGSEPISRPQPKSRPKPSPRPSPVAKTEPKPIPKSKSVVKPKSEPRSIYKPESKPSTHTDGVISKGGLRLRKITIPQSAKESKLRKD